MDFIYGRKSLPGALTDSKTYYRNNAQQPIANKQNFKSTKLDTKVLKEQLNIINNERKSLTRQSITEITKDLDQTKSRRRLSKVVIERESFPVRKEAILENLVSKLESEEELRHILERRCRNSFNSTTGLAPRNSIIASASTLRIEEAEPRETVAANQYFVERLKHYEEEVNQLRRLLSESNEKVKRLELQRHSVEVKPKTREKATQTTAVDEPKHNFIQNLERTLEVLNNPSGSYVLY